MKKIIIPKENIVYNEIYGEGTIMDLNKGVYIVLNQSGTIMWTVLSDLSSFDLAIEELGDKFSNIDNDALRIHTRSFLEDLINHNLIENSHIESLLKDQ